MPKVSNALVPRAAGTVSPYYSNSHREISHLGDFARGASRDLISGGLELATGNIPGAAWSATKAVGKGLWHGGKAAVHGIKNSIQRRKDNKAAVKARKEENKHAFDQRTELNKENTQLANRPSGAVAKRPLPNTPSKKDSVAKRSGPYKLKPSDRTYQDRMNDIGNEDIDGGGDDPMDPETQIVGNGGGGRGAAGSSRGLSFSATSWFMPRPVSQKSFYQTFTGMTNHKTVSLSGDNYCYLAPWSMDYYFNHELGSLSESNEGFLNSLINAGCYYRIPHAKIMLDVIATTRETIIIQAATQYKTREIMDVPLLCSIPNIRYSEDLPPVQYGTTYWGQANPYTKAPQQYTEIEWRTQPECEISVGETWEESFTPSGKHYFHSQPIDRRAADADKNITHGIDCLPIYCEETRWDRPAPLPGSSSFSNKIETGNRMTVQGHTDDMVTTQFNNNSIPLKKYCFKAPDIEQEDNNKMVFNYTIRIRTEITFELFRNYKDIMVGQQGKHAGIDKRYLINLPTLDGRTTGGENKLTSIRVMYRNHGMVDDSLI